MARKLKYDRVLFIAAFLLVCSSVVMVYSSSAALAGAIRSDEYYFMTRQVLWAILGSAALAVAMRIDYRTYRSDAFVWVLLGIVTLLLVAVFFSPPVNGAHRWLRLGGLGGQPSELAKLACVFFAALMLERRMHRIDEISYSLLPLAIVVGVLGGLIYWQPDLGTAASLLLIVSVMVFAAGLHYGYLIGATAVALPAAYFLIISEEYRARRLEVFWDPWSHQFDGGYQTVQSLIAVGTGGVFGRGLTESVQKLFFLPEPHTDFIYAVIAEELGLVGATGILVCFCVIGWRGLRVALRSQDPFGSFVALGITTMICAQAFINMSVVLDLVPNKGIPLPLVSSGGSSLLVSLAAIGVLLNISQHETEAA